MEWLDTSARAAVVLVCALIASRLLHGAAAAARHAIWCAALAGVGALPLLEAVLPPWRVALLPAMTLEANVGWPVIALLAWIAGLLAYLARTAGAHARISVLVRRARPADDSTLQLYRAVAAECGVGRPVSVLISFLADVPFTCGCLRPVIVLPADATEWTTERLRAVFLHELAHIRRHDWLVQAAVRVICAAHWFNPLVWIAAHRLREEAERACDDFVVARGLRPSEYARDLLELSDGGVQVMPAMSAAHTDLRGRLLAILDPGTSRRPLSRAHALAALTAALAVVIPAAVVRAPEPSSAITAVAASPSAVRSRVEVPPAPVAPKAATRPARRPKRTVMPSPAAVPVDQVILAAAESDTFTEVIIITIVWREPHCDTPLLSLGRI